MIEEGVKFTLECGHSFVWPKSQLPWQNQIGEEVICKECPREVIFRYQVTNEPVYELNHFEPIEKLEKVRIITTVKIEPWD